MDRILWGRYRGLLWLHVLFNSPFFPLEQLPILAFARMGFYHHPSRQLWRVLFRELIAVNIDHLSISIFLPALPVQSIDKHSTGQVSPHYFFGQIISFQYQRDEQLSTFAIPSSHNCMRHPIVDRRETSSSTLRDRNQANLLPQRSFREDPRRTILWLIKVLTPFPRSNKLNAAYPQP